MSKKVTYEFEITSSQAFKILSDFLDWERNYIGKKTPTSKVH